jgi:Na+-transporting methylmalonyl-CoA/oxaloacetate decarboxylase beta subunit
MHTLYALCQWLENTSMGTSVRESLWEFPLIETVHIFGIILLVGSTSILDLRLMGLAFKEDTVSKLAHRYLPWTWAGFVIQVVTGFLLFASEATKMEGNIAFQLKMLMIVLAGLNAFIFHSIAYKSVGKWEHDPVAPLSARFAGTFSILLWFGIVAAGRWIAYV